MTPLGACVVLPFREIDTHVTKDCKMGVNSVIYVMLFQAFIFFPEEENNNNKKKVVLPYRT